MILILRKLITLTALAALTACGSENSSQNVSSPIDASARLVAAAEEPENWLNHGRTYDEQRHSPLSQINTENVTGLGLECRSICTPSAA